MVSRSMQCNWIKALFTHIIREKSNVTGQPVFERQNRK